VGLGELMTVTGSVRALMAGEQIRVGYGLTTALPGMDFETKSAAGFHWDETKGKWTNPPGAAKGKKGLEVVGRRNYIKHPSFGVLSLCYDLLDGKGLRTWYPSARTKHLTEADRADPWAAPWDLIDHIATGGLISAWNSGFEFDVWNEYCVPTWGWPELKLEQTRCDMAKARAHAGPGGLGKFGEVFQLKVRKDKDGDRLLKKFSIPQNPTAKRPGVWIHPHEDPQDFAKLLSYNGTDVLSEAEASLRAPDLSPEELQIWLVDQRVNLRGIQVDVVAMENCIAIVEQAYQKYNAELCTLTNGAVKAASELDDIKAFLNARGVTVTSLTEDLVDEWIKKLPPGVERRVLEIRQLLGSASIKKLFAFRHQNHLGRLYDLYSYFAARTGRWTGNGPQPQNLPSGLFHSLAEVERALSVISHRVLELVEYEYPGHTALEVVGSVLRGLLIAAPGYELICSDYTAIEGVITAALAGEQWRLEIFHTHGLIYEASAAAISGVPFAEFVKHRLDTGGVPTYENGKLMHIDGGKHHPLRKKLGKFAELGSGFGGWIPAWCNFGADEFLSNDEIKRAILAWRDASPRIVEMWGGQSRGRFRDAYPELFGFEGAAIAAVQYPGRPFSAATIQGPGKDVIYQMSVQDDILYCRVPSGGFLTYHRPRLEPSKRDWAPPWEVQLSYEGDNKNPKMGPIGWIRMSLYGGKQTENIVQKEGRAIHAGYGGGGLVALDAAGYRPVIHSHDEPCGEVPMGWGTVEEFETLMCRAAHTPGSFCYGWPIKAKGGWRGPRYGKFE
jgi:DNA polymerase